MSGKSKKKPVCSMTGFGQADADFDGRVLGAEARSVNHRFLELSLRTPRAFQPFESKLRAYIQERLNRGKLNLTVAWKEAEDTPDLTWNAALADRYFEILQEVRSRFDLREPVTLSHLLAHPEIFASAEPVLDDEAAWQSLRSAVGKALDGLVAMREAEGRALVVDLQGRLDVIRECIAAVESRSPERAREAKEKLHQRVQDLLKDESQIDPERIQIEAALLAERMDCTEECVRLASHIDQFESMLEEGGPVGRKLNFLLQEMNREANTIGSKANDAAVARHVIQLKEEIEILREQIQNLE